MSRTLKERIARLERRKSGRSIPRVILAIYERTDDEIIGYQAGKLVVMRAPGEVLSELQDRAWALGSPIMLVALYRPENRPAAIIEPTVPPDFAPSDPFASAGIGRQASPAELLAMGAIQPPTPERLI